MEVIKYRRRRNEITAPPGREARIWYGDGSHPIGGYELPDDAMVAPLNLSGVIEAPDGKRYELDFPNIQIPGKGFVYRPYGQVRHGIIEIET